MAKTLMSTLMTRLQRRIDYDITDSDLNNLMVDAINDGLKLLYQWLFNAGIFSEISATASLDVTASQAYIDISFTPSACAVALAGAGAGNVDNGAHGYKVTFVTARGESEPSSAVSVTVVDLGANGRVAVTSIPTSPSSEVTSRRLYRTAAGGSSYLLLTTISDNTTTTYTDNTADSGLGAAAPDVSTIPPYTEIIRVTERTNDGVVWMIPYDEFMARYPDPTANSASTPDHCALWNNRLYLGPTPSAAASDLVYIEYLLIPTDLASTNTLPYSTKYDPLVLALAKAELTVWLDSKNTVAISEARRMVDYLKDELITGALKNVNTNRQVESRRSEIPYFAPKKVIS